MALIIDGSVVVQPKVKTATPVDPSDRKFYIQGADRPGGKEALKEFDAALKEQHAASSQGSDRTSNPTSPNSPPSPSVPHYDPTATHPLFQPQSPDPLLAGPLALNPLGGPSTDGGYDPRLPVSVFNRPTTGHDAISPGFVGERSDLFDSVASPSDAEFSSLVDEGSIAQPGGRQTRYFDTHAQPGDGVIVTEFVIQEERSGGFLVGDGRDITDDPLGTDLPLDASRMIVIVDRETGRGVITVSPSAATFPVDVNIRPNIWARPGQFPIDVNVDNEVGARPINLESGKFSNYLPEHLIPENYFGIQADADNLRIDYDAVNSVTAFGQAISVDGPIVLERGADGQLTLGGDHSPDLYPAVAVTQYTPDGERRSIYFEEGRNVFEGASPAPVSQAFEAGREVSEEFGEGWNEVGEARWYRKPDQVVEAGAEVVWEVAEGTLDTLTFGVFS
ncbi:MAG: hypothetical protein AAF543_08245 [Pseudomonadota bacterium]